MQSDDSAFVCQISIKHLGLFAAKKTLVLMSGGMFTAYESPQVEIVCFSFLKGFQSGRQRFNTGLLLDCISIKWVKLINCKHCGFNAAFSYGKKSSRMTILWNNGENDGLALELGGELIFKVYIFKAGLDHNNTTAEHFHLQIVFSGGGAARRSYVQPEMYY